MPQTIHAPTDPYRTWLGLNVRTRPQTAYQYLKLAEFESDMEVIRLASQSQRALLQQFRHAGDTKLWLRICRELDTAIAMVSDPAQKEIYDHRLRESGIVTPPNSTANTDHSESDNDGDSTTAKPEVRAAARSAVCPKCESPISRTQKFCLACGHTLWEECVACKHPNPSGAVFCGQCGGNLGETVAAQRDAFLDKLAAADALRAAQRFSEALTECFALSRLRHPFALKHQDRVAILKARCEQEQQAAHARCRSQVDLARQLLGRSDYPGAIRCFEDLPSQLLDSDSRAVRAEAESKHQECRSLRQAIEAAVRDKKYAEALAACGRLHVLSPGDRWPVELAAKLQDSYLKSLDGRLKQFQYEEALKLLTQIPPTLRRADVEVVFANLSEVCYLRRYVRLSPYLDESVLGAARRLRTMLPKDLQIRSACEALEHRQTAPSAAPGNPISLATPPKKTALEIPVELAGGFQRMDPQAILASPMVASRLADWRVACGLALQGLGKAAVPLNLASGSSGWQDVLERFSPLKGLSRLREMVRPSGGKDRAISSWGVELGDSGIKAVKLEMARGGSQITATVCDQVEHARDIFAPDSGGEREAILKQTIQTFLSRHDLKSASVVVSISSRRTLTRFLALPPVPVDRLGDTVKFEAPHRLALPLAELNWDFAALDPLDQRARDRDTHRICLVAAKRLHLSDHLKPLVDGGLPFQAVQSDAAALFNFVAFDQFGVEQSLAAAPKSSAGDAHQAVAYLDLGAESSNLVVCHPTTCWMRSIPLGGLDFTRALIQERKYTYSQADEIKRIPTRARRLHQDYQALRPVLESLLSQLRRSLSNYAQENPEAPIQRLFLLGGCAQLPGLVRFLRYGE